MTPVNVVLSPPETSSSMMDVQECSLLRASTTQPPGHKSAAYGAVSHGSIVRSYGVLSCLGGRQSCISAMLTRDEAVSGSCCQSKSSASLEISRGFGYLESVLQTVNSSLPCRVHYRNNAILDRWQFIEEVVVALYEHGELKQSLTFDATGTDYLSWFSPEKLKDAGNWKDLKGLKTNYFSIPGYVEMKRNFYINYKIKNCAGDISWLIVVDHSEGTCNYENIPKFPVFLYSTNATTVADKAKHMSRADVMAIFVKYHSICPA
ncbi:uncharacterized protein LOC106012569 [Aplysia californica]|uniref:Uncharacterized protein LOC106012569 n=1 Tax=Aplysia californica TaxID=6500 RepID=A0ABM1A5R1_APLCA|nr:uncharacterized protein LOC106012569 [Aplysia californica]